MPKDVVIGPDGGSDANTAEDQGQRRKTELHHIIWNRSSGEEEPNEERQQEKLRRNCNKYGNDAIVPGFTILSTVLAA